ncbi:MAG: FGGY-family carbohydrate kinase [Hyphomicrobiales bacterium]
MYLGIDVGTGGARAGVFDEGGALLGSGSEAFALYRSAGALAEYASGEIWQAVCAAVKAALADASVGASSVSGDQIAGIGFDATCSMVITPGEEAGVATPGVDVPISINPDADGVRDSIAWLDHRAVAEAEAINASGAAVLQAVGGRISPEMQVPKLAWLAKHQPDIIAQAGGFYDLPDWLVHRATGSDVRSLCSLVCKWTYNGSGIGNGNGNANTNANGNEPGWDAAFFDSLGLGALLADGANRVGRDVRAPGDLAGHLTAQAAAELGLADGIPVAVSLIDAHAGALGTLGVAGDSKSAMALIAGTSACHIVQTEQAMPVPGVWGPYADVIVQGQWTLEAGQSACGALLDVLIARHAASADLPQSGTVHDQLADILQQMAGDGPISALTRARHVVPDVLGNRSPLADPSRQGAILGFGLDSGPQDLALDYLAGIQALACGTRHILDQMAEHGVHPTTIVVSGGLIHNPLLLAETATVTGCQVLVPAASEPVLLGSAMLGAVASGAQPDLATAMKAMGGAVAQHVKPDAETPDILQAKYNVFRQMLDDHATYAAMMAT